MLLGVDVMDATDATVVLRDRSQVDPQVIKQAQLLQDDDDGQVGGVAVGGSGGGGDGGETTVLPADLIVWTAGALPAPRRTRDSRMMTNACMSGPILVPLFSSSSLTVNPNQSRIM